MNDFTIKKALVFGWINFRKYFPLFLFPMALTLVSLWIQIEFRSSQYKMLINLAYYLFAIYQLGGVTNLALKISQGKTPHLRDFFIDWRTFLLLTIFTILGFIVALVGFVFLIIPGLYLTIKLFFSATLVVDKKVNPFKAISQSFKLTKGHFIILMLFGLIEAIPYVLNLIYFPFVVLSVAIYPISILARVYLYQTSLQSGLIPQGK